ncbi:MAG: hypothetical protein POG74_10060 [Acidocella sp.]|nr:hypothetical protein [Acidocella sp.]
MKQTCPAQVSRVEPGRVGLVGRVGLAVIFAGYGAALLVFAHHARPSMSGTLLDGIFRFGAFNIAAWLMIFARARAIISPQPGAAWFIVAAMIAALAAVLAVPSILGAGLAMALLGGGVLLQPKCSQPGREAGWLLLALAGCAGTLYLDGFSLPVVIWDAQAAAWLSNFAGFHASAQGPFAGVGAFRIIILTGCSSVAPLASVLLAYLVILLYLHVTPGRADIPWLLASLATSVTLTEIRLSLMLPSYAAWDWWHNGPGVTVYELTALAAAASFPLIASRRR